MTDENSKLRSGCPINYALEIFGDRWTLLVLRDLLLLGKQRYREFLHGEEGVASNILADRLKRLEQGGFISRRRDPTDGRQRLYAPTDLGRSLIPVLLEIAAWGASQDPDTSAPPGFVEAFRRDREAFIADPQGRVARLRDGQMQKSHS